jgi:hypothetical protein
MIPAIVKKVFTENTNIAHITRRMNFWIFINMYILVFLKNIFLLKIEHFSAVLVYFNLNFSMSKWVLKLGVGLEFV